MQDTLRAIAAAAALTAAPAFAAEPLIAPQALAAKLGDPDLVVIDVRSGVENGGDAAAFAAGRVPGAVYANYQDGGWRKEIDGVVGMLPPVSEIEGVIRALGVDGDDHVVIYSAGRGPRGADIGSATRVYWTLKALGHDEVSILDGGWKGWRAAGLPVESGAPEAPAPGDFRADFQPELYADASDVALAMTEGYDMVDARPTSQFTGESKSGVARRYGAIPGAVSYPITTMITENGGRFLPAETIKARMAELGVDGAEGAPISYCNTGHWASVVWFAISELGGLEDARVYDGSMADWSAVPNRPMLKRAPAS